MKLSTSIATLTATLLTIGINLPAQAEWYKVAYNPKGDWFIDGDSVQINRAENLRVARGRHTGNGYFGIAVNCNNFTYGIHYESGREESGQAEPNTVAWYLSQELCSYH